MCEAAKMLRAELEESRCAYMHIYISVQITMGKKAIRAFRHLWKTTTSCYIHADTYTSGPASRPWAAAAAGRRPWRRRADCGGGGGGGGALRACVYE